MTNYVLLRFCMDIIAIIFAWYMLYATTGFSAIPIILLHLFVLITTTFSVKKVPASNETPRNLYKLPDGRRFLGTQEEHQQYLKMYYTEDKDGKTSRPEDEV